MKRERKPGVWEVVVYHGVDPATGKKRRISRTVRGGPRDAQRVEAQLLLARDEAKPDAAAQAPLRAVLTAWLDHTRPDIAASTWVGYEQKIRLYLEPELGDVPLAELTAFRIDAAYTALRTRPGIRRKELSPTTVHHCHTVLHAALAQAVKWGWIDRNPADQASPPAVAESTEAAPSVAQAVALLSAALAKSHRDPGDGGDPHLASFVALAIATGARRGAISALRWTDIDFDSGTVIFRNALSDAGGTVTVKGPKTKKRPRPKRVDDETLALLRARHVQAKADALAIGERLPDDAWVFSYDGQTPIAPSTLGRRYARLAEKVAPGVRLHDLRHFSVTHLLGSGLSVRDVAERHDHASARMTLDRYADAIPASDDRAAQIMGEVVSLARVADQG